ncbi:MAG: hypothetical protein IJF75_05680 [Clostridia bacterium]|nr:hypothetical protein [Clostridia bacterium]
MKKIIALLMFAVLSISVLALTACGKEPSSTVTPPQSLIQRSSKNTNSSTIENSSSAPSTEKPENSVQEPTSSTQEPTSSTQEPTSSSQEPTSSTQEPTSSTQEPTSSQDPTPENPTPTPSGEILSTTETSVKNSLYVSSLRVGSAGLYYLGSNSGSNYIFKVEVTQGSTTYVLNASDMTAFDPFEADGTTPTKQNGEKIACGTNNYFSLLCSSGKTKIDASAKTFSDGFSGTKRINFGGKTQAVSGVMTNAIEFTTTDAADVKVWWVCGGDGRQVDIIKGESSPVNPEPTVPAEVTALIAQIDAIGTITVDNYVAKETEVAAAESAYTALGAGNQALVTNYAKLTSARAAINEFKAAAEAEAAAQEKVTAFKNAVTAIGEVSFTPECKALLDAADAAYALVPTTHQSQVATEKAELEAKKQAYLDAELATLPQEVQDVMTSINAIGEITVDNYLAKETEINGIETNYSALSPENQALVSNYAVLTSAKAKVEEFKAAEAAAQEKITEFRNAVTAIGTVEYTQTCKDAIDAAYVAYDAIPATHNSQVATEKATLDSAKAQYDELVAVSYVTAFENAVSAIATPITVDSKTAIDAAYTAYNAIPATHTANAATAKATLDGYKTQYEAAVKLAADQQAVSAFMTQYNACVALGTVSETNRASFEATIAAYEALTTDQKALITDATVATNIATWKAACEALKPAEPVTTTMSFENTNEGITSSVAMKFGSSKNGKGWQTSTNYKNTTITFTTDASYNNITSLSVYVMSSGGGGVQFNLYIGSTLAGSYKTSSSGFDNTRKITYSGTGLSGQIKIEAVTGSSSRGAGIDELVFTHTPAN